MGEWYTDFVALDTETTGLGEDARIVEIAVVRFVNLSPIETWDTLLNPVGIDWHSPGVRRALEINHLEREELESAPSFAEVLPTIIAKLVSTSVWVAHNTEFDLRMLRQEEDRLNAAARLPTPDLLLDTLLLDFMLVQGFLKRRLDVVCPRWGVSLGDAHRARADALACGTVLCNMVTKLPPDVSKLKMAHDAAVGEWRGICDRAAARQRAQVQV